MSTDTKATTDGIRARLARAQAAMTDPRMTGNNPHFNSKFVPRDQALDAILPALKAEGLTLSQGIFDGNLVTKVIGDTEELVLSEWPVAANSDPQKYMSATTYASRGSLMLAFARAGDGDDDGTKAAAPRDYKRLTDLKSKWADRHGVSVKEAAHAIVEKFGNPGDMDDTEYQKLIKNVEKFIDKSPEAVTAESLADKEEVPF